MVTADVISTNLFNCMFCIGICGVGSDSGANSSYCGSSLAHHHHHTHSIHLTMAGDYDFSDVSWVVMRW